MVVGAIPFGIIFGAVAVTGSRPLSPAAAMGMSLIVFAGSAQFIAAGLYGQGAGLAIIVLTTFIVNLRHALYSASLAPYMQRLSQKWLLPLGFWLTDETYAVVVALRLERRFALQHWFHRGRHHHVHGVDLVHWHHCRAGHTRRQRLGLNSP
jgi:predicted branched-subunit amino acid permease